MDNKRRDKLRDALTMLERVVSIITTVCDKEENCVDNYPENLQNTETYENMEAAVENLNDALDKLDEAKDSIEAALG